MCIRDSLLAVAKKQEIPMFIVGHVNKDGAIAGPKVMEHIVDTAVSYTHLAGRDKHPDSTFRHSSPGWTS